MASKGDFTLSIVVPAYNEAENIQEAIEGIIAHLPPAVTDYEIIIIDDGSKDNTGDLIRRLARDNERISLFFNDKNCGKGASLITGFRSARMDWVLFLDADLQIDINELTKFMPHTYGFDLIAGYRLDRRDHYSRIIFSKIYAYIIHILIGVNMRDINCPFKLIRSCLLKNIELYSKCFFIDAELVYQLLKNDCRTQELPVASKPRQKGNLPSGGNRC